MPNRDEIAKALAEGHSRIESSISKIVRLESPDENRENEPIKLLEVTTGTAAAGIVPVTFGPGPDVPYPSIIVDVTPEEFERIERSELRLPRDWRLGEVVFSRDKDHTNGD